MTENELLELVAAVAADLQGQITDECRAYEEDDEPGILLTVGTDAKLNDCGWQSGDNSYSGAAYFYPYWGVSAIYPDSDPASVAQDILDEILRQIAEATP